MPEKWTSFQWSVLGGIDMLLAQTADYGFLAVGWALLGLLSFVKAYFVGRS